MPVCSTPKTCLTIATLGQTQATTDRGPCTSRRTLKKVTEKHSYIYASGKLLRETITGNGAAKILDFRYDQSGAPYSLTYTVGSTSTVYYYVTNLQGDVMYLVDSQGNEVAAYTYDPYGKVLTATGAMAEVNPLRYRGYYQDSETGFYYLQSRYYDPAICRFLNADSYASTGQGLIGYNAFAYCLNNPGQFIDISGSTCVMVSISYGSSMFIYDQQADGIGNKKLGVITVSHGGCGPVATYNSIQFMGRTDVTFDDVLDYYNSNNKLLLGGLMGSSPYACIDYFRDNGYSVFATKDVNLYEGLAETADACILWCWFDTDKFPGIGAHFIAFKQYSDYALYYNAYSGMTDAYRYTGSCSSFLDAYNGYYPVMILVYDCGRKK